jgi:hypothetical protein
MTDEERQIIEALAKQLPIKEAYEDGVQKPLQEAGNALTDIVKTGRLLLAPFQLGAAYHERFARYCKRIADKVPEERRIEVMPVISGPVLEALRYVEEDQLPTEYMLELLSCAMDSSRVEDAHPAFGQIVSHLSPDEALILFHLKKRTYRLRQYQDLHHAPIKRFGPATVEWNDFPTGILARPDLFLMYMSHLLHLDIAGAWGTGENEYPKNEENIQTGLHQIFEAKLTPFGEMFARACVPDELPNPGSRL